nr:MAG TPA: hypothetical protein [Caudoviricetes sp.]
MIKFQSSYMPLAANSAYLLSLSSVYSTNRLVPSFLIKSLHSGSTSKGKFIYSEYSIVSSSLYHFGSSLIYTSPSLIINQKTD